MRVYMIEIETSGDCEEHVARATSPSGQVVEVHCAASEYVAARTALASAWLMEDGIRAPEDPRPVILPGLRDQLAAAAIRTRLDASDVQADRC